jgi:hypothetical protein
VFVALNTQNAMRMHHIFIGVLLLSAHISTLSHERHDFVGGGGEIERKLCFDFCYKFYPKQFSFKEELSKI